MTILFLLLALVLFIAFVVLVVIVSRHFPELRILNVKTDARVQSQKKKEDLILGRLARGSGVSVKLGKALKTTGEELRRVGRRSIHRLRDLEVHYQELKRKGDQTGNLSQDELLKVFEEATELVREEDWAQAEKKYIEVISLNPKEVKAYEYLGRLYIKMKQFDQADQCLRFATKLRPNDASVRASLGELYMIEEQWTRALEELGRAIAKRPGNPKYLDRYIETALALKDVEKVKIALRQLQESNPDNQKIEEFEERLAELA
ncbi:MAG: Tetratricopeptide TPR_1 repeat-containing protein [Candidatus Giovannonibacteria bacterium GW2011_GWA2_53_7]|uniref:Tetratricopeptide TPR_1 repeat-containing protein n=1 Tax=Candidatus Giovannonibacteria bacterium GW2011_GWA2_53_7 TaxID=1618650 RepID=A0A0G1Y1U3_9BACT|nr:MAG: Tetratricopeptide TPR_1 repeat-containing protein [Candidatus Giovannonibacteria bacterium GW2011_GWA2_53_7]